MKKLIFTLLSILSVPMSLACTPGAGNGPSGDPNCMGAILNHDPYYNRQNGHTPQQPHKIIRHITVNIPSKYGALALDEKTSSLGSSNNQSSLAEAKKAAIRQCGEKGCKVITWVKNGCIAAAGGKVGSKWKLAKAAEERGDAEQVAMSRCQKSGISDCAIVVPETCSIPDTSQY